MKWKVAILTMAAASAIGFYCWQTRSIAAVSEAAATTAPKPVPVVAAAGRVEPVSEEIRIGSERNGKLREVTVNEGDRIRRGQVVAILENADYVARVASAEALLARRMADEQRVVNGSRTEERAEASATVAEAKAVLENALADQKRYASLFASGDIPRATMDRAEREVSVAKARFDALRERQAIVDKSSRQEDLDSARAEVAHARALVAEAKAMLDKTYIRSPIDGVVLRKHLKSGESVSDQADAYILTVGDNSVLRVRVDVDEADIGKVHVGQRAYVRAEAYGDRKFTGKVTEIGQILGRKNVSTEEPTERVDTKVLETLVQLDPGQQLPAGLRVDAFIQVN